MRKPNHAPIVPRASAGRFFVLMPDSVQVHLIDNCALSHYWEGLRIAEERARDPAQAAAQVRASVFRVQGSLAALPAPDMRALVWYMDSYTGPQQLAIRATAAALLLGRPIGGDAGDSGGGTKIPAPKPSPRAPRGDGATFDELVARVGGAQV